MFFTCGNELLGGVGFVDRALRLARAVEHRSVTETDSGVVGFQNRGLLSEFEREV